MKRRQSEVIKFNKNNWKEVFAKNSILFGSNSASETINTWTGQQMKNTQKKRKLSPHAITPSFKSQFNGRCQLKGCPTRTGITDMIGVELYNEQTKMWLHKDRPFWICLNCL